MTDAQKIAEIIRNTDTEKRGNLFLDAATELRKYNQHSTAHLLEHIARLYGTN